ncbi:DUF5695 domain-containing protein [Mucilaginibacter sp. KACC 22063]|uniref:DUF5695 domain-containing protein n=1 Tax=Mucilaginibacter sp. KACC 22063 TaxID=3025666 RepID=UPI0023653C67|nr:DUF5695 domain-containing protein [Mucilaginibacter sp. KACC 22063]WDF53329.1 DUF5695 domain-containing protein [Mucilaginibacter sp. KACC 22063]
MKHKRQTISKKFNHQLALLMGAAFVLITIVPNGVSAQSPWEKLEKRPSTLGLENGTQTLHGGKFTLKLAKASQTVAALSPDSEPNFDFTPGERLKVRSSDSLYHLGDINLRIKRAGDTTWTRYSTAAKRKAIVALPATGNVLAVADLTNTLPASIPVDVKRYWLIDKGILTMQFRITNTSKEDVEIGDLGMPVIFNNIMEGKTLEAAHATNVFYDPYIGEDAGYLQVTRLSGHGPALIVIPSGHTPFEAYNPLLDDRTPRGITFEGFYEWMVHSKASAGKEWKAAEPWNLPTSHIIKPNETYTVGLSFILSNSIKNIENTLAAYKRPVAVGVPGYVLPQDVDARLFLRYGHEVKSINAEPAKSLQVQKLADVKPGVQTYSVKGITWGRARLTITYDDGIVQTINYKVVKPEATLVKDFGRFLTNEQWYENDKDPFGRNHSVITYDYEKHAQVTQDGRVWISGLSDEGGAGSWLGAMMKEFVEPDKTEVNKLQLFVNHTIWGGLQHNSGPDKYGVKKSMFYYQPDSLPPGTYDKSINYNTWAAWNHKAANDIGRSYNYPHVAAAHWVLYRLARNHVGLVTEKDWQFYLTNAYGTAMGMVKLAPYYVQFGQMEGTVFYMILNDLKAEGWTKQAQLLEAEMKKRALHWSTLQYPFGSEMPWDSTGQEEVYVWSKYFGYNDKADVTINAILGYMPTIPHWGYNGSARRYWDFLYGGKLSRIERQLHHYGSGINAIPMLMDYRTHPKDLYMLRVGYGGTMGAISNINQDGFGSAAFHSFPSTLKPDGLSGDYGPNFFGYAMNTATYILNDANLGWLAFGGNLTKSGDEVNTKVTTAAKSSLFIAPAGLWITLNAGEIKDAKYNIRTGAVTLILENADAYTPVAYVKIEQNLPSAKKYILKGYSLNQRKLYAVKLSKSSTTTVVATSN